MMPTLLAQRTLSGGSGGGSRANASPAAPNRRGVTATNRASAAGRGNTANGIQARIARRASRTRN